MHLKQQNVLTQFLGNPANIDHTLTRLKSITPKYLSDRDAQTRTVQFTHNSVSNSI